MFTSFLLFFLTYTFPSFRRYDIATKVPAAQLPLVLGGEMSMWTDSYCYIDQCGSSTGRVPTGHALFDPAQDAAFGKSIGGMIWPRGFVGAAAFWNYNNATNPADPAFVTSIYKLNDEVKARGGFVCATNCSCNQNTQCGVPYIQTPRPHCGLHRHDDALCRRGGVITSRRRNRRADVELGRYERCNHSQIKQLPLPRIDWFEEVPACAERSWMRNPQHGVGAQRNESCGNDL